MCYMHHIAVTGYLPRCAVLYDQNAVYCLSVAQRTWYVYHHNVTWWLHYNDVVMSAMASQITSLTIVYRTVYSGADQRKHQSSASLAFVREIHRSPSIHNGCFMYTSNIWNLYKSCFSSSRCTVTVHLEYFFYICSCLQFVSYVLILPVSDVVLYHATQWLFVWHCVFYVSIHLYFDLSTKAPTVRSDQRFSMSYIDKNVFAGDSFDFICFIAEEMTVKTFVKCYLNSLRPRLNRRPFADDIFKCIFLNEN